MISGNAAPAFSSFNLTNVATGLTNIDVSWDFEIGDYNGGGKPDMYGIRRAAATEVHVFSGESNFVTALIQKTMPLISNAGSWDFAVADWNLGGIHILSGEASPNPYSQFLLQCTIPLYSANASHWAFEVGDYNGDGKPDLIGIRMQGSGSGKTEFHILSGTGNGCSAFQTWMLQAASTQTTTDGVYHNFGDADWNAGTIIDAFDIKKNGATTEVHTMRAFD